MVVLLSLCCKAQRLYCNVTDHYAIAYVNVENLQHCFAKNFTCLFSYVLPVSFAPISFAIKVKETDLLPLEKNRVKLDDDSDEEEDGDGKNRPQNKNSCSSNSQTLNTTTIVAEEKKPQLTPEELEAKQGISSFLLW